MAAEGHGKIQSGMLLVISHGERIIWRADGNNAWLRSYNNTNNAYNVNNNGNINNNNVNNNNRVRPDLQENVARSIS